MTAGKPRRQSDELRMRFLAVSRNCVSRALQALSSGRSQAPPHPQDFNPKAAGSIPARPMPDVATVTARLAGTSSSRAGLN